MYQIPNETSQLAYGWRAMLYLLINFSLGLIYTPLLLLGFGVSIPLSFIWVGIPMFVFVCATTRRVADFDRWLAVNILGMEALTLGDDLDVRGRNPIAWATAYLASATTWQRVVYLFAKLPLGVLGLVFGGLLLPLLLLETVLASVGIDMGTFVSQMTRAMASGTSGAQGATLIPAAQVQEHSQRYTPDDNAMGEKRKRLVYAEEDTYYINDDGEIDVYRQQG